MQELGAPVTRQDIPFGDPGVNGCLRLTRAFRSLPRPSSAPKPSHPPGGVSPWVRHPKWPLNGRQALASLSPDKGKFPYLGALSSSFPSALRGELHL